MCACTITSTLCHSGLEVNLNFPPFAPPQKFIIGEDFQCSSSYVVPSNASPNVVQYSCDPLQRTLSASTIAYCESIQQHPMALNKDMPTIVTDGTSYSSNQGMLIEC